MGLLREDKQISGNEFVGEIHKLRTKRPLMTISHISKKDYLLKIADQFGLFDLARKKNPNLLTVLNYHRIEEPDRSDFSTFKPNISATPLMFEQQMDYLLKNYNVVSGADVTAWVRGGRALPPHAALITFDDGYYDNFKNAFPVLAERNLPAIIFLASDFIGGDSPFYWDLIAYCFNNSLMDHVSISPTISYSWNNKFSRDIVVGQIIELAKKMPEADKRKLVDAFPDKMDVSVPLNAFDGLFLTWDDVRALSVGGIEMGAHTASHPILTRVPIDKVEEELYKSKIRIEGEINSQVVSFAYPNGQPSDFNSAVIDRVKKVGFHTAYTLLSGPTRFSSVKKDPYQIRRIFLSYKDTLPRFAGKLIGLARIASV